MDIVKIFPDLFEYAWKIKNIIEQHGLNETRLYKLVSQLLNDIEYLEVIRKQDACQNEPELERNISELSSRLEECLYKVKKLLNKQQKKGVINRGKAYANVDDMTNDITELIAQVTAEKNNFMLRIIVHQTQLIGQLVSSSTVKADVTSRHPDRTRLLPTGKNNPPLSSFQENDEIHPLQSRHKSSRGLPAANKNADVSSMTLSLRSPNGDTVQKAVSLAISMEKMASDMSKLNRHEEALEAARKAVSVRRALAESDPSAFNPALASSLRKLASYLSKLNRYEDALETERKALSIFQALADSDPDTFNPRLADSLYTMTVLLPNLKRYEEALEAARKAVSIRQKLAESDPGTFNAGLAESLYNIAVILSNLNRNEEALEAVRKAVFIRRELAENDPGAFNPVLADSLRNMAFYLSNLNRHEEALEASRKVVLVEEALADADPNAFNPVLAVALSNLSLCLFKLNRFEEALTTARRALSIRQALAESNPGAFNPALTKSLHMVAGRLCKLNRYQEALEADQKAVSISQTLADSDPEAFNPLLAQSLRNMALSLRRLNRREDALAAERKAASVHPLAGSKLLHSHGTPSRQPSPLRIPPQTRPSESESYKRETKPMLARAGRHRS